MMRMLILTLMGPALLSGCTAPPAATTRPGEADVAVFTRAEPGRGGILVEVAGPVHVSGAKAGQVPIQITNLLTEEVFVEVTGFDDLAWEFKRGEIGSGSNRFSFGGGGKIMLPDNTRLLKRLHAAQVDKEGRIGQCGCAVHFTTGQIGCPPGELKKWIGADTKVRVPVVGYLRRNGREFSVTLEIPIQLIEPARAGDGG